MRDPFGEVTAIGNATLQVGEFEVRVGIDQAWDYDGIGEVESVGIREAGVEFVVRAQGGNAVGIDGNGAVGDGSCCDGQNGVGVKNEHSATIHEKGAYGNGVGCGLAGGL